jgi:hypothetical protein
MPLARLQVERSAVDQAAATLENPAYAVHRLTITFYAALLQPRTGIGSDCPHRLRCNWSR